MTEEIEELYIMTIRALMRREELLTSYNDSCEGYISHEEYEDKVEEIKGRYKIDYSILNNPKNLEILKPIFKFAFDDITIEQIKYFLA